MGELRQRVAVAAMAAIAAIAVAAPAAYAGGGAETLLFEVREGRVILTNTPSSATRPVPGFERPDPRFGPSGPATAPDDLRSARAQAPLPTTPWDAHIERVAIETGLSPRLIKAVALVESAFDPQAVSHKGAQGLMQLMPGTAEEYGVTDPFDPWQNLLAGATHLRLLVDEFDGDLDLALAAYNAGAGAVRRHGGVPNYRETRSYVRKVRAALDGVARPGAAPARPAAAPARPARLVTAADGSVVIRN